MIKKFESYNKINFGYIKEVFAEFIDSGSEHEILEGSYFEIFIEIPGVRKNEREWVALRENKIEHYLEKSIQQTEVLQDVNVCIKRVFDELKVLPKIEEEDYEDNETGLLVWCLHITYEN
jgi:hypothetical protein